MTGALPYLGRLLSLMTPARVSDGLGGYTEVWTELGKHWAEVVPRSGTQRGIGDLEGSAQGFRITVRAAPIGSPRRPRPGQILEEAGRRFRVLSVTERDRHGRYLQCDAQEETVAT